MNIVFFGTPYFAVPALEKLILDGWNVSAVYTQPDKPRGRQKTVSPAPVKIIAEKYGLKVHQPRTLKDDAVFEEFKSLRPDICVVAAYGKIIPARYIDIPKYGFLNIHPSLLPKYRGPSPIQTAIINGDERTGVSIMLVDEEIDHGPLLAQKQYDIPKSAYFKNILNELAVLGAGLLVSALPGYTGGTIKPKPQDHKKATFTKMLEKEDGKVDWKQPARKISNLVRALNTEPGAWAKWQGKTLNILKAEELITHLEDKAKPGTVVTLQKSVAVKTGTCYLNLLTVQLEGGKEMDAKSFVNGHPDFIGSTLE